MDRGETGGGIDCEGAAERRRFAPSPPCLAVDQSPPPNSIAWNDLPDERQRQALSALAAAIDAIHRFRVAHGSLDGSYAFVEQSVVWLSGVGAAWTESTNEASPRDRDLAWFRRECERLSGPSLQPGIGRTCLGMLHAWREPPPANPSQKPASRAPSPRIIRRRPSIRRRLPWRAIFVVAAVVLVVGGVAAWQLTPLPKYTTQSVQWVFRKLPDSVRDRLDPTGMFDPADLRIRRQPNQDQFARLEMNLGMQQPTALMEVLTGEDERYTELFRNFMLPNDAGHNTSLMNMFLFPRPWHPKALPRLKTLLAEEKMPSRRTLEHCFLRAATAAETSEVERILATTSFLENVPEAYAALARIGSPQPIARLEEACRKTNSTDRCRYLPTVIQYYPDDEVHRFLTSYSVSRGLASFSEAWTDVYRAVETTPDQLRNRASSNFERVLVESIPKTLAVSAPSADVDLLMTLLCLWRLQTVSPDELLDRLSAPTPQGVEIRRRLTAMLIGSANDDPERISLPESWEIPDEWYATMFSAADFYPAPFVRQVMDRPSPIRSLQQQSRLLALANLRAESARQAFADDLAARLSLNRDDWRNGQPLLITTVCASLAAVRRPSADAALRSYLEPGPLGRETVAWDGLLVGAVVEPARLRPMLEAAATHPLPSIWTRARDALALADGNVAAFRNPDRVRPEWNRSLTSLVAQLGTATTEAQALVILSRQREGHLAELALGLTASPGALAVLHTRVDRNESPLSTHTLIANQPTPLDDRRFGDFLHRDKFEAVDPAIMIGQVLRDDLGSLATMRAIAIGPRGGKSIPPLVHRAVAMYALGALQTGSAAPAAVNEILVTIDRDASMIVRHAAAAAALRSVRTEDKKLLLSFVAKRPKLPPAIADVLKLAEKL